MKIKVSNTTPLLLNYMVAKAEGLSIDSLIGGAVWAWTKDALTGEDEYIDLFNPCTNWSQAGPIIEREKLCVGFCPDTNSWWSRNRWVEWDTFEGATPLIAAMRCYVTSKLGDVVEVPDKLI